MDCSFEVEICDLNHRRKKSSEHSQGGKPIDHSMIMPSGFFTCSPSSRGSQRIFIPSFPRLICKISSLVGQLQGTSLACSTCSFPKLQIPTLKTRVKNRSRLLRVNGTAAGNPGFVVSSVASTVSLRDMSLFFCWNPVVHK